MIALGVVFSSYASEVFLSAFRAIPHGQYEGGYAIGLTSGQTMRLVVLPQLIRIALPGLANLLADPAQGHGAGFGRSASRTSCVRPASLRASPSRPSCSSASPPDLSGAGDHLVLRHPAPSSAAVGRQEARPMSASDGQVTTVERPPPPARGWPRERIVGYVLVGIVDRRSASASSAYLVAAWNPELFSPNTRPTTCAASA